MADGRTVSSELALTLALASVAAIGGCHRADSVLLVEVGGELDLPIAQLGVTVTIGAAERRFMVPSTPATIQLPTSFTVELDRDLTGPVMVTVDAFDAAGTLFVTGRTTQEHIKPGDDTIISVILGGAAGTVAADAGTAAP